LLHQLISKLLFKKVSIRFLDGQKELEKPEPYTPNQKNILRVSSAVEVSEESVIADQTGKRALLTAENIMYIRGVSYFPEREFDIQIPTATWKKVWNMKENTPKGSYPVVLQDAINTFGISCSYLSNEYDILKPGSQLGVAKF